MISIEVAPQINISDILRRSAVQFVAGAERTLVNCIAISNPWCAGMVDGKVACIFGLVPPTLLSNRAYIWLLTTDLVEENKFLFVRYSQRFIEAALEKFPELYGHVDVREERSLRWLRLLGA